MSIFLITRPEHDDTTHYLSYWSRENIGIAESNGFKVIDLHREKAKKEEFENKVRNLNPKLIMLNGHGSEDSVTGHKNQVLVKAGENEDLLKDRVVYALSCKSAKVLGPKSIQAGALNYTGFEDDFIFIYDPTLFSRPLIDKTAELFLMPSNIFVSSLLKGNDIAESFKRAQGAMQKNLYRAMSSAGQDSSLSRFLWWNLRNFKSHGNLNISLK